MVPIKWKQLSCSSVFNTLGLLKLLNLVLGQSNAGNPQSPGGCRRSSKLAEKSFT